MTKNIYKAFYREKSGIVYAETSHAAQIAAAKLWRVRPMKEHQISVVLIEIADGRVVSHSGAEF